MEEKNTEKTVDRELVLDILNYTQSMEYTPKPLSWFLCKFYAELSTLRQVLAYLEMCCCLKKNDGGLYEVMRDLRMRVRGKFCTDGTGGYVIPDSQRIMQLKIHVPEKWCMGAMQNDRVSVVPDGVGMTGEECVYTGAVEEIISPFGDSFCGTVRYIRKKWYVVPFDVRIGSAILMKKKPREVFSGDSVFARLTNGAELRKSAFEMSDIRQKKKTIVWKEIENEKKAVTVEQEEKVCCVLCKVYDCAERFAYENRLHRMFENGALYEARRHERMKRTSESLQRRDLTETEAYIETPDFAYFVREEKDGFRFFAHAADITDYIIPGSSLDKELLGKGYFPDFLPRNVTEACAFAPGKQKNAVTVEFLTDKDGRLSERTMYYSKITCGTEKPEALEAAKMCISVDDPYCTSKMKHAAEYAVMDYFDEAEFPAPFINIYEGAEWPAICSIAEKLDLAVDGEDFSSRICSLVRSAKTENMKKAALLLAHRAAPEVPDWIRRGVSGRVDFVRPFSSYLSIAAQHAFVQMNRRQSRDEYAAFASRMREITSVFMNQAEAYASYQRILKNLDFFERDKKQIGATYRATVIKSGEKIGQNETYLVCDGIIGCLTDDTGAFFKTGDEIPVVPDRLRADGLWLYFRFAGEGMPAEHGVIYENKQNNLKK